MLSPAEIAAYVGAAAWLPHVFSFLYRATIKPKITIVPEKQVEIGYTTLGPIFNLRLVIFSARKGIIIDHVRASIHHEDGSFHDFSWAGMKETFSEIKDRSGTIQAVEREYSPIALVLHNVGAIDRFFRFQSPSFQSRHKELLRIATDHEAFLQSTKPDYQQDMLNSKQVHDVLENFNQSFIWKPGRYVVKFSLNSPTKFILTNAEYVFHLKPYEITDLQKNLPLFKIESTNVIMRNTEGFKPVDVHWHWVTPSFERVEKT